MAPSVRLTSLWGPQPPEGGDGAFSRASDQARHTRDGENRLVVLIFAVVRAVEVGVTAVTPPCVPINQKSALTVLFFKLNEFILKIQNQSANAGDTGLIPGPGRFRMLWGN